MIKPWSSLKWLIPGMRVKRWLMLILLGALIANVGSVCAYGTGVVQWWGAILTNLNLPESFRVYLPEVGLVAMVVGVGLMLVSAYLLVRTIAMEIAPEKAARLADVVNQNRLERLLRGREIVVVGGGTGLATMLRGLKRRTGNITAVVTVSDDGGSSGRLLREFGMAAPGDIRNCLVAMADEEPLLTALFNHRFGVDGPENEGTAHGDEEMSVSGAQAATMDCGEVGDPDAAKAIYGGIRGHSLGNLFLAALTQQYGGHFEQAVKAASRVLAIRGQVLPSATTQVSLVGEMSDGSRIRGETAIVASRLGIKQIHLEPPAPKTYPEVIEAIMCASVVVIGPGSVYTSIVPNLLVPEIRKALEETTAIRVYVCNVMTQPGETDGFTAADHLAAIKDQTGFKGFDYVLVNNKRPSAEQIERYRRVGAEWVRPDVDRIRRDGYEAITGCFISEKDVVRHDAEALSDEIYRLFDAQGGRIRW